MASEFEKLNTGAPDFRKKQDDLEKQIRSEVLSSFPEASEEVHESIIQSRLKILNNSGGRPQLIQVDLGESASKKIKENLFE